MIWAVLGAEAALTALLVARSTAPARVRAWWKRGKVSAPSEPLPPGVQVGGAAAEKQEVLAPTQSPPKFAPPPPKQPVEKAPVAEVAQGMLILRPAIVPIESFSSRYEEA